ncbi:cuticle protein [Cloeon dipterum]|uniref:cuticle protein n=1 Tax=Cloeon dipterum TaxID=197152 RepID=UPI003220401E
MQPAAVPIKPAARNLTLQFYFSHRLRHVQKMLKATLLLAALGVARAGVVPVQQHQQQQLQLQPQQYLAQGPAPTYIAAAPAGFGQQVRALPPIYRTAAPAAVAVPQQALYRAAPAPAAVAINPAQFAYRPAVAAAPAQFAYRTAAPAPAPVAAAAPAPAAAPIQDYQNQALAAQRAVQARPQAANALRRVPAQQTQQPEEDYDPNPAYNFSFDVKDDQFTNYQNRKEQREGDQIKGSYSVVDSDGFIRTVTYTADPVGGFKAEVIREPTDIKVLIPTPAPATQAAQRAAAPRVAQQQYQPQPQQYQQQQYQPQQQYQAQQYQQPAAV